jgi:hypothetical protein
MFAGGAGAEGSSASTAIPELVRLFGIGARSPLADGRVDLDAVAP